MSSTLLVDSSVWIDYHRGSLEPAKHRLLMQALDERRVALTPIVWLELVVGFRSPQERERIEDIRIASQWVPMPEEIWEKAEAAAVRLHQSGVVLRAADLLILTVADLADLKLLHCDRDFDRALKLKAFARLAPA